MGLNRQIFVEGKFPPDDPQRCFRNDCSLVCIEMDQRSLSAHLCCLEHKCLVFK